MDNAKKRRTLKGKLTRLEGAIGNAAAPLDERLVERYQLQLEQHWTELNEIYEEIGAQCDDTEFEPHQEDFNQLASRIESLQIRLPAPAAVNRDNGRATNYQGSGQNASTVKLPRLDLPTFSGDLHEWTSFYDLFVATVQGNEQLAGSQKLQYLKAALRGEAASLLQSIQITDNNFPVAWDILTKRYQNRREIVNAHLNRLCNQSTLTAESPTELRKLIDITNETVRALRVLEVPVDHWDLILVYLVTQRLDHDSRRQWELTLHSTGSESYKDFMEFLEVRARALMTCPNPQLRVTAHQQQPSTTTSKQRYKSRAALHADVNRSTCSLCKQSHPTYKCNELLQSSIEDRRSMIREHALCYNCLSADHSWRRCKSGGCKKCGSSHHTLLHQPSRTTFSIPTEKASTAVSRFGGGSQLQEPSKAPKVSVLTSNVGDARYQREQQVTQVLLATALVKIRDVYGNLHVCRALLDSGSQATFITTGCVQRLELTRKHASVTVSSIGASNVNVAKGVVQIRVTSRARISDEIVLNAIILKKITGIMPTVRCDTSRWTHIPSEGLADPEYFQPNKIDVLFGADVLAEIVREGLRRGPKGTPTAQDSSFGWLVSGQASTTLNTAHVTVNMAQVDLSSIVQKFWELDSAINTKVLSSEETKCEEHFTATHTRDLDGRFVVRLPLKVKEIVMDANETRVMAARRLQQVEKRLAKQQQQYSDYREFMNEYKSLGHMKCISANEARASSSIYLPHHAVIKETSSTTRLRVVFDASAKGRHGASLNDHLLVGPTIQDDIFSILIRFRTYAVAITADISKMYRQVRVHDADTHLQTILWRDAPDEPVQDFRLLTLTYGTACAPYLAVRCLKQLAKEESTNLPEAAEVVERDFYVDDLLSGANSVGAAIQLREQVSAILNRGGFYLRKWASNLKEVLDAVPIQDKEENVNLRIQEDGTVKTLGLQWNTSADVFTFQFADPVQVTKITKRTILSTIAKIYDPLGVLAPVTVKAKIILQQLWRTTCSWDDNVPIEAQEQWTQFRENLAKIQEIRIPRKLAKGETKVQELHGFCDASEQAYAAVIYLKSAYCNGEIEVTLVAAKTRVAPLKTISIPRLELCSALLLTKLFSAVQAAFKTPILQIQAWTDSTVALTWIKSENKNWKTFVGNRVTKIREAVPADCWRHVKGNENPADCASRGVNPRELKGHALWWKGPNWLATTALQVSDDTDMSPTDDRVKSELRIALNTSVITPSLLNRYSSLTTLTRVTAYIFRFFQNCKLTASDRFTGPLSCSELNEASRHWIKVSQQQVFSHEIRCLKENKPIPASSHLITLKPFLDIHGIIRVGGRLKNASITIDQKFPIVLPRKHVLTDMIVKQEHLRNLHAGPQMLLYALQQRYWILGGRDVTRQHVHQCVTCQRQRAKTTRPIMGNLPSARVIPARPFQNCGVDFAGPMQLCVMKIRSQKTFKAYVAIFVCFVTHAVHLELVSDLSTNAFLAGLRRFIARRGHCTAIYSDQGTNFVGASHELKELQQLLRTEKHNESVAHTLGDMGTQWHFNPPGAPHFGGLWEAGVKSMKYHLRRVVGNVRLNYEEMTTVLTQIEACLNSRPLCPLSPRPDDLDALTPGHFLIGGPLTALPEPDYTAVKMTRLSRWQLVQQLQQHFWKRWKREYLSRLQQRPKAWTREADVKLHELVLLKDENQPPSKWRLGRVVAVHPGSDDVVRVVTVKTASGEVQRPVVKLCPLPVHE